jgi:FKBP-type peptidyl-prolyl cis-trans isomerase
MLYVGIVLSGNKDAASSAKQNEETTKLQEEMTKKQEEMTAEGKAMGAKYLDEMKGYKSRVKSYNATTANSDGLKTTDLKKGTGTEITQDFKDYYAYYIGFCANEKVFDSSFDSYDNPTSLKDPISGQLSLVAGWTEGVVGMKVGGVREVTIPSELGYAETDQADNVCGKGAPMKFVIYAMEPSEKYLKLKNEYEELYFKLYAMQMK